MNTYRVGDFVVFNYKDNTLEGQIVVKMGDRHTIKDLDDGTIYRGIETKNITHY
mgnify:CR=1 FL=1